MPKLWVMICPKGTYELIVDSNYKPELSGEARWDAMKPITQWKPEVMEQSCWPEHRPLWSFVIEACLSETPYWCVCAVRHAKLKEGSI